MAVGRSSASEGAGVGDAGDRNAAQGSAARSLAGACLGSFFSAAAVFTIPFGVFVNPIMADAGWSRETVAGGLGVCTALIALCSPLSGRLADRMGMRLFTRLSFPAFGLALAAFGLLSRSELSFLILAGLLGVVGSGQTAVPYSKLVVGWFDKRRGIAFGTMLATIGIGIVIMPPVSAFLIGNFGWRSSYVFMGLGVAIIGSLGAWILIFDPPAKRGAEVTADDGKTLREAFGLRSFWILNLSILIAVAAIFGVPATLPSLLEDGGISSMEGALVLSVFGVSIVLARFLVGFLLDYFWAPYVTIAALLAPVVGLVLLSTGLTHTTAIISAILLGIGFGSEIDVLSYMASRAFGRRNFGQIFGTMFVFFSAANGVGPIGLSLAMKQFGNGNALVGAAALICLSMSLLLLLKEEDFPYGRRPGKSLLPQRAKSHRE